MALMWRTGAPPPPKQAKAKAAPKDDDEGMPDLIDEGLDVLETADMPGLARASSGESGKSPTSPTCLTILVTCFSAKRQGASAVKLHVYAARSPHWTRQIQAKLTKPWARCLRHSPPRASQGQALSFPVQM